MVAEMQADGLPGSVIIFTQLVHGAAVARKPELGLKVSSPPL